ncbi:zinc finger, c4 type (two domains) domain-containing protein [Ditylenchus destructor]|nr:zinc finger, c4 type (two domains) domain-containing protein [Ditylenchus destructor]
MQAVNNADLNPNAFGPTTSHESHYSGSFSTALATSVDSLGPTKIFFDSEYLTFTSSELQNSQLKPANFDMKRDMEMPTKCLVCEQPTNSCHYDVPSCHGCKTFFRRALLASRTYACKLNGMCRKIIGIDRCRACRFDRCVLVGMNPRAMQFPTSVDVAKLSDRVSDRRTGPVFEETIEDKIIQSLVYVELKVKKIRESSRWLSESVIFRSVRELLESKHENVLAHADQYPKELTWPLTIDEASLLEESEGRPNGLMVDVFLSIEMMYLVPKDRQDPGLPSGSAVETRDIGQRTIAAGILFISNEIGNYRYAQWIFAFKAIHGLSVRGRILLEKECGRYAKTLMKHLQSRMGAAPGAKKYAEIVSFVGCLFHGAQQMRELYLYDMCAPTVVLPSDVPPVRYPPYIETIMYAYFS